MLRDGSLTQFLEQSQALLRYHTQVDRCHDIAPALVYLLCSVKHLDLSSKNAREDIAKQGNT